MGYWDSIGATDAEYIDLTNEYIAQGMPLWPSGVVRFRIVRTWQSLIVATDGMSGLGCELFVEIPQASGWMRLQVTTQWEFAILRSLAFRTSPLPDDMPIVMPVPAVRGAPTTHYAQLDGTPVNAAIIGMDVPGRPPRDDNRTRFLPVTPISAAEFVHIYDDGLSALGDVVSARVDRGVYHLAVAS